MTKRLLAIAFLSLALPGLARAESQANIPPKISIPWGNSAGSSYIRSIPNTSQIGIQNCAASYPDGFPPLTFTPPAAGGCPPFGQDFNGVLKQLSQWNRWQALGGPVFYDGTFSTTIGGYPNGAKVMSAVTPGTVWMSTADNNSTNPDTSAATNWVQDPGQVPIGTPVQTISTTVQSGYVSANGLTVGNASSNATGRANADTQFLFNFVWNNCSNAICPIFTSTGSASTRGATPWADFAANKAIAVWNMNGSALMGVDSQGGSSSTRLSGVPFTSGSSTTPGSLMGENLHTLTAGQIPTINSTVTSTVNNIAQGSIIIINQPGTGSPTGYFSGSVGSVTSTGSSTNTSGQSHNTVPLATGVAWNLKL